MARGYLKRFSNGICRLPISERVRSGIERNNAGINILAMDCNGLLLDNVVIRQNEAAVVLGVWKVRIS